MGNMRPQKFLFILACVLFLAACSAGNPESVASTTPTSTAVTETATITPLPTQTAPPLATPTLMVIPSWMTDFSDPILLALMNRVPDYQDDFSFACIYYHQRLEVCPPEDEYSNFEQQFSILNLGWFYMNPENRSKPFYAHIQNGSLLINLPEGNEKNDSMVYNPNLIYKNFVLNFDLHFSKTEPDDVARFQFGQSADESFALDVSKNETWAFHWGTDKNWETRTGTYDAFPPERINLIFIVQDKQCAILLNNVPLGYFENCRSGPVVRSAPWAVSFHLLGSPGYTAEILIDNVKLWDLDKVQNIP
jgi:hypothetical protein